MNHSDLIDCMPLLMSCICFLTDDTEDQSESEALSSAAGRPPTGKSATSPASDDESRDGKLQPMGYT